MRHLTLVYDAECGLCSRLTTWLRGQPKWIPLYVLPSSQAVKTYPALAAGKFEGELIVFSDEGAVYTGDRAWVMCLFALKDYREWARRLSRPALLPFARQAFKVLSNNRRAISKWLGLITDSELQNELRKIHAPECYGTNR